MADQVQHGGGRYGRLSAFRFEDRQYAKLVELAASRDVSVSALVREATDRLLESPEMAAAS